MFAEVAARLGRYHDAENLLARCLELAAPAFTARAITTPWRCSVRASLPPPCRRSSQLRARAGTNRSLEARISRVSRICALESTSTRGAAALPNQAKIWLSLRACAQARRPTSEGIHAYRRSSSWIRALGEAWWSLANLKTFRFTPTSCGKCRPQLARSDLKTEDRYHFHFALGKTLEE